MDLFLILASLFFIGSLAGWVLELFFRRFFDKANPERKWVNPGFCTGPYLPIYGCGLCVLYLITSLEKYSPIENDIAGKTLLLLVLTAAMTLIEYLAGLFCLKVSKVRLWDYSMEWGNIQGIICPKYTFFWAVLSAVYYFIIHPHILNVLTLVSGNFIFTFVLGMFFGIFIVDVVNSAQLVTKMKKFAVENNVVVQYEEIKIRIIAWHEENKKKYRFFTPFRSEKPISEYLKELSDNLEKIKKKGSRK